MKIAAVDVHLRFAWTLVVLGIAGCGGKSAGSGDGRLETLATSRQGISNLAVDGADLYWNSQEATSNNNTLMTMPVVGGTPRAIASGPGSGPLAFDASSIYWVTWNGVDGAVLKIRREDHSSVTLATGPLVGDGNNVGVNSRGLYLPGAIADPVSGALSGGVLTIPLDGGTPQLFPGSDGCGAWAFVDEANLYCTSIKIPLDGSPPTQLATPANNSNSTAIFGEAIDASNLYVVTYGCHLLKVPLDGESAVTLATLPTPAGFDPGYGCGGGLAVDANNAYVANTNSGMVVKAALDGSGVVTTLATVNQGANLAVDATSVYITDGRNDGEFEIIRVTPK